jgi:L-ribulokinase
MTGLESRIFRPNPKAHAVYQQLYALYRQLHDAFGTRQPDANLYDVMKRLITIRNEARS